MDQNYAQQYRVLYQQHWWWRAREKAILEQIQQLGFQRNQQNNILDVGCGDGLLFDALQPFGNLFGVEADQHTLSPDSKWRDHIYLGLFDQSYQPDCSFDLILMLDFLEHLQNPEQALIHAAQLLKPHGRIIITVPAHRTLWTSHDDLNHHFYRFNKASFRQLARDCQVKIHHLRYLFHWTCPVKLAIRAKEAAFKTEPTNPEVPSRFINSACYAATRFEQLTVSRLGMPFGSSLLAIASNNHLDKSVA